MGPIVTHPERNAQLRRGVAASDRTDPTNQSDDPRRPRDLTAVPVRVGITIESNVGPTPARFALLAGEPVAQRPDQVVVCKLVAAFARMRDGGCTVPIRLDGWCWAGSLIKRPDSVTR